MGQVIADVAKDASTEYSYCCVPIVEKNCMGELVKRCRKGDEKGGWHHKAVLVHWEVMVDAVEEKVSRDSNAIIR